MKIQFGDASYLEVILINKEKVQVTLAARDGENRQKHIINSTEIYLDQFLEIVEEIKLQIKN